MSPSLRPRYARAARAFTLVELMVVIAIIGMLAAVVTVNVMKQMHSARVATVKANMEGIESALKLYKLDRGRYPRQLSELWEGQAESYLDGDVPPRDPWGQDYVYTLASSRDFELVSYGADGSAGGSEEDADLSSKTIHQGS